MACATTRQPSCGCDRYGRIGSVRNLPDAVALADADGERRDALEFLLDWARDPEGQPCCALLGQLGMGKTTTCMALSRELLAARQNDRTAPLPIYFDLRHLGEDAKREPDLAAIIDTVLRRSWRGGQMQAPVAAAEVVRLVQQEGAIAIFDGLDEVLVHLRFALASFSRASCSASCRRICGRVGANRVSQAGRAA